MANDREVLREVWEGRLPISFRLDPDEVHGLRVPDPFYLLVPRLSYFPLVTDKIRKQFSRYIDPEKQNAEMWLDFNGTPLKWHYPIGLLFDLSSRDIQLPWNITVHFSKFPEEEILHCQSREVVESYFMSRIKEADALKHRSQVVSNMQKKDHNQLWLGLQNDKFDQFWAVNRKLMEVVNEEGFKYIPFKCYQDDFCIQKLVRPITEEGQKKLLQNLIDEVFSSDSDKVKVFTHGIEPPKDTPLQWMSEHLSYPDNFLHLCDTFLKRCTILRSKNNVGLPDYTICGGGKVMTINIKSSDGKLVNPEKETD